MQTLVLGAGGFIGSHMVKRLKSEGAFVRAVDIKHTEFFKSPADEFIIGDLRNSGFVKEIFKGGFDEVYQFAADMGGAGYVFTGENDAVILHNNALINLNVTEVSRRARVGKVFYSSSACIYPQENQLDPDRPDCEENTAYPAHPDSDYGWEKLFSERLYQAYNRNCGLDVRIARYHNIYGPEGTYEGGREKAPAAICRKVAAAQNGSEIEVWGDGKQTRSFLFIEDCIEATRVLMKTAGFFEPVNIGSEEMVSIDTLCRMVMDIANKKLTIKHIQGPQGVRGRNSHNALMTSRTGWAPQWTLQAGLAETYRWISEYFR